MTLNPQQFGSLYHGTDADIPIGGHLLPGSKVGRENDTRSNQHAYTSEDEEAAWSFAAWNNSGARARVYRVSPAAPDVHRITDDPDPRVNDGYHGGPKEVIGSRFKVEERIDVQPGAQGTFPQEDWARHYRGGGQHNQYVVNHPEPAHLRDDDADEHGLVPEYDPNEIVRSLHRAKSVRWSGTPGHNELPGQLDITGNPAPGGPNPRKVPLAKRASRGKTDPRVKTRR